MLLALSLARRQRNLQSYFVGDRNVSWVVILFSIVATETSTVTFLSIPGTAFDPEKGDFTFLQLALGFALGRVLVAWLLLPQYLHGRILSVYEILQQRFRPQVQRVASAIFLAARNIADGLRLCLTAYLLQEAMGFSFIQSVLALGLVTILYTYLGGIRAVLWTDSIQFFTYLLGGIAALLCIVNLMPGGMDDFWRVGWESNTFAVFDFSYDPQNPYTIWAGLVGGAFISMATHGADQIMVQRYLCARSLGEARAAVVLSGVFVFVQFFLFLVIGAGLYALFALGRIDAAANDRVFADFIVDKLPVGLVGLVVAGVLAAAMSTLSSSLNSSANAFVNDFYRPLRSGRAEDHYLNVSRLMTVVWGLVQIAVALVALRFVHDRSIINGVLAIAGFTTGLILGLFLLGSFRRSVSSRSALIGLVVGFLVVLSLWLPSTLDYVIVAWPWYAPIGTVVTVLAGLLAEMFVRGS